MSSRAVRTNQRVKAAPTRLLRGWEVQSYRRAPTPGGIRSRSLPVPNWRARNSTNPPQTVDAARDIAEGEACGGHDSCSASRSVRLSRPRESHRAGGRVPHFSRSGQALSQRREKWGARLSPVRLFPGRVGSQAASSHSHRPSAAASRQRTVPDRSGKFHRIADNSWVTIRTIALGCIATWMNHA